MRRQPFIPTGRPAGWLRSRPEAVLIPVTIGAMVGCIAFSLVRLLDRAIPGWNGALVVAFCSIAAAEAAYSYRQYRRDLAPGPRRALIQVLELTTLCVVRQVWETVLGGHAPLQGGVPRFDPQMAGLFLLTSSLIFLSWLFANALMHDLDRPRMFSSMDSMPALTQRRLVGWCLLGGALLFILAGLSQPPVAAALGYSGAVPAGPTVNVLLYGLLALALLAQMQFARLQQQKKRREVIVGKGFTGPWLQSAATLAALMVFVALLVPNRSLLYAGQEAWGGVSAVVGHIGWGARSDSALSTSQPVTGNGTCCPERPAIEVSHGPPAKATTSDDWNPFAVIGLLGPLVKVLLLWFILLASLAYRVRRAGRRKFQAPGIPAPSTGLWCNLRSRWGVLWHRVRRHAHTLSFRLPGEIRPHLHVHRPSVRRSSLPRLRRLSPRDHVLYTFLRLVREAERHGFGRAPSRTPHEFTADLSSHLTEGREDLEVLAASFVEARYSNHEVGAAQVERVRASRRRAHAALHATKQE